jgi:hypothetical protein
MIEGDRKSLISNMDGRNKKIVFQKKVSLPKCGWKHVKHLLNVPQQTH